MVQIIMDVPVRQIALLYSCAARRIPQRARMLFLAVAGLKWGVTMVPTGGASAQWQLLSTTKQLSYPYSGTASRWRERTTFASYSKNSVLGGC